MKILTLSQFNKAYQNIISQWGDRVDSNVEDTTLLLNLKNNCEKDTKFKIAFDQKQMTIYTMGSCDTSCPCAAACEQLIQLVELAVGD